MSSDLCPIKISCHNSISNINKSTVVAGSGKTLAFAIPMIHSILEWRNSSSKPVDDNAKAATQVESLYLPECAKSGESPVEEDEVDGMDAKEDEDEAITEQDQGAEDEYNSEDGHDVEGQDDNDDVEFDFDQTTKAEEKLAGSRVQPLLGLVLTPTRELAVQVKHHIDAVAKFTGESSIFIWRYDPLKLKSNSECQDTQSVTAMQTSKQC